MVKKLIVITILFATILYIIPQVFACSIDTRPYFHVKTPQLDNCYFVSHNENLSSDVDIIEFINNKTESRDVNCDNLVLSESDQQIFRNVINQFNKQYYGFGSVNIEKQSNSEYDNFQNQVVKINADKCDCEKYDNISRDDDWTVYVKLSDCGQDTACQAIPPEGCFNRLTYDLMWRNPFVLLILIFVVPIATIIGIVFLIRYLIKKSRNK